MYNPRYVPAMPRVVSIIGLSTSPRHYLNEKFLPVREVMLLIYLILTGSWILIRGPIHIHLTRQNVNLTLCVQPTHPPNITSKVKYPTKIIWYLVQYIQDLRLFTLSFHSTFKKLTVCDRNLRITTQDMGNGKK